MPIQPWAWHLAFCFTLLRSLDFLLKEKIMSRTSMLIVCLTVASACLFSNVTLQAAIIAIQGPLLTDDNSLLQGFAADDNRGGMSVPDGPGGSGGDARRMLLRFNLSSLAGQTVTGASLQLTKASHTGTITNGNINIYQIFGSNAGWIEGTDTDLNVGVDTGRSTWTGAVHGSVNWVNSGGTGNFPGLGNAGDAYAASPLASFLVNSSEANNTTIKTINFANTTFVQNWIDNPSQNAGMILIATNFTDTWRPYNSEATTAAFQPILFVTLADPAPEPGTCVLLGLGLVGLSLRRRRVAV